MGWQVEGEKCIQDIQSLHRDWMRGLEKGKNPRYPVDISSEQGGDSVVQNRKHCEKRRFVREINYSILTMLAANVGGIQKKQENQ